MAVEASQVGLRAVWAAVVRAAKMDLFIMPFRVLATRVAAVVVVVEQLAASLVAVVGLGW